jgi:glycosyltransferase involved in cell wall biosynthesis
VPDVALVHDYFAQDGGGERVAVELSRLLPRAKIYTTFFDASVFGARIDPARVHTWTLQDRVSSRHFRRLLPLYPMYFSALDLRDARLVVSSSSAFAKAVRTSRRGTHVSYIHTPMRFAYDPDSYLGGSSFSVAARVGGRVMRAPLASWDRRTARRPNVLVANSQTVRARIRRHWRRDAEVIYPPVSVDEFRVSNQDDGFLLIAARLLAYRRIDAAVRAATTSHRQLIVVGDGPERRRLENLAGPTVRFEGWLPRVQLVEMVERCHAYLVPGEEDFGIAPVEAMAAGKPVVALARGGATETVIDGITGVLYEDDSPAGLNAALDRLDTLTVDREVVRQRAEVFSRERFFGAWRSLFERLGIDRDLYDAQAQ